MESFSITGHSHLKGQIKIQGAKNSALKLMAASILADSTTTIKNIPKIKDVFIMEKVLSTLGMTTNFIDNTLEISPPSTFITEAPYDLVNQMRASIIVLGPLLAKCGKAHVALPGGCNIGYRKIDMHLRGLEVLGAKIHSEKGFINATAKRLTGNEVILDFPSVGATENLLMASVLAKGKTVIDNVAREPEIDDLANFLKLMGAKIDGIGTARLEIEGVTSLNGIEYTVMPDRIEAGTFLIAAALTNGEIKLIDANPHHLELVISKLKNMGVLIEETSNGIYVNGKNNLNSVDIVTLPYPGFPTDLQAQIMALLSLSKGTSILTENVFENRFLVVDELNRMGADIRTEGHHAVIKGVDKLYGVPVAARDLRGGAALVLAGLAATGTTIISDIQHIDRGYQDFDLKLNSIGAKIERITSNN